MIVRGEDPWAIDVADRYTATSTPQKDETNEFTDFGHSRKYSDIEANGEGKLMLTPRAEIRNSEFKEVSYKSTGQLSNGLL